MNDHPEGRDGFVNPSVKYERTDLSLRAVLIFAGVLVAVIVGLAVGLWNMIPLVLGPTRPQAPLASNANGPWKDWNEVSETARPVQDSRLPPPPELEAIDRTAPRSEGGDTHTRPVGEQIREEEEHLNGYGWADKDKTRAYIPIEAAMGRLAGKPAGGER